MKKSIKRSLLFMMSALMAFSVVACKDDVNGGRPADAINPYDLLGLDNIHIGMWVTPPAEHRSQEAYDTLAESGINFVNGFEYFESDEFAIREALGYAENSGLKFLVADKRVSTAINDYQTTKDAKLIEDAMLAIESYYDSPAYAGQLLIDEPDYNKFDTVNAFIEAYKLNYPGKQWHVNMFPSYAESGAGVPYLQYVEEWMDRVKPNYYSFDSYPLLVPDETNPFTRYEIEDYYYNLDLLRVKTAERKIPLWSFIQTLGISGTPGVPDKRIPSREDIRWQVFTNLAFGVKGLQYFCYWTPGGGSESFTDALIAQDGTKTERYDYVKEINNEILGFGKQLIRCDSEGMILHTNQPSAARYKLYEESLARYGILIGVEGDDVLIGCFKDPYTLKESILLVPVTPRDEANVSLKIKSDSEITVYQNGEKRSQKVKDGKFDLQIQKGDAAYILF